MEELREPYYEPQVSLPNKFDGKSNCRNFLNQVRIIFLLQPKRYPTDNIKVGFFATLLTGAAAAWFSPLFENGSPLLENWEIFVAEFERCFGDFDRSSVAANKIHALKQGWMTVSEYASAFRQISCDLNWGEEALMDTFRRGLRDDVKDLLITLPPPTSLMEAIHYAVRCDNRLMERKSEKLFVRNWEPRHPSNSNAVPMEIDATKITSSKPNMLSQEERNRRRRENLCLYCGKANHRIQSCPVRLGKGPVRF